MIVRILTANELTTGMVVFFAPDGRWIPDINEAEVAVDKEHADILEGAGREAVAAQTVVDPYLVEVERSGGGLRPTHIRERIRTLGPTVRADLGKQADGVGGSIGPVEILET